MKQEEKIARRNQIVSELIAILQTYDCRYGECFFDEDVQMGVVSFSCDMVSRNVIRDMEKKGLVIYHIYYSKNLECYKVSFKYEDHD